MARSAECKGRGRGQAVPGATMQIDQHSTKRLRPSAQIDRKEFSIQGIIAKSAQNV